MMEKMGVIAAWSGVLCQTTLPRPGKPLRQVGLAHQISVALARSTTTFVESPNNEALASTTVARGEDSFDIRGVLIELGFDICAGIAFDAQSLQKWLFRAKEAHC